MNTRAPQVAGVVEGGLAAIDDHVDGTLRGAIDQNLIDSSHLEPGAPVAAGVARA
jgi:hypothetical protein